VLYSAVATVFASLGGGHATSQYGSSSIGTCKKYRTRQDYRTGSPLG